MNLTGKNSKTRKLSAAHAYSKLYFKTKIKPVVEKRWQEEYLQKNPQHQPGDKIPHWEFKFQNVILQEMWKAEPDSVKADVRRRFGLDVDDSDGENEPEPEPEKEKGLGDGPDRAEVERVARAREYQSYVPRPGFRSGEP